MNFLHNATEDRIVAGVVVNLVSVMVHLSAALWAFDFV